MGTVLIFICFPEEYLVTIDGINHLIHLPNIKMEIEQKNRNKYVKTLLECRTDRQNAILHVHLVMIPVVDDPIYAPTNDPLKQY